MGVIRPVQKTHDPKGINSHLKVQFSDVLAEPEGTHSYNFIWQGADCCFKFCFSLCYGLPVALQHLCLSPFWGVQVAYLSFYQIWLTTPFLQCLTYVMHAPATCYRMCTRCVLDPWCEAAAYMFMFFERPPARAGQGGEEGGAAADWKPMSMY